MNRPNRLRRSKTTAARPARPWAEAAAFRSIANSYQSVSAWVSVMTGILFVALVATITHAVGGTLSSVSISAGVAAAISVALHLVLKRPDIAATLIILTMAITFAPPVAAAYATGSTRPGMMVDAVNAITTLVVTYLLIALLAHRTSRGRAWLTTAITLTAVMLAGPFLLLIYPPLGFGWAWGTAGTMLWLRSGGIAWLNDWRHRLTLSRHATARRVHINNAAAQSRAQACATTATLLDNLPTGYTVFHGRRTPRIRKQETHRVDHLVIGPTGLSVVTSLAFKGRVVDDPDHGLIHDNAEPVDIAGLLNDADVIASTVATRTKMPRLPVRQIVVIHDAVLPAKRSRVGLVATNGKAFGVLIVMSPDMLLTHVTDTEDRLDADPLDDTQVAQVVARINRLCPPHRAGARRARGPIAAYRASMVVMDNDGNRRTPTPRPPQPMFVTSNNIFNVSDGQQVCLLTDQGVYDGYHIAGEPVRGEDGITRVPVLDETIDLTEHHAAGGEFPLLWMPFDSIQPLGR